MSRTTLVTGGTGSFGRTIVRHLLDAGDDEIRVLSRDETKQDDMRREYRDPRLRFLLGDVRDIDSVREAATGVHRVFHAAALKQVPSCEFFPIQAVQTNVMGSSNVINAAASVGVPSVVCLSTDKAVYPINAMGTSKAMMEKVAQAFARNNPTSATTVSITRYGNVMYSRGSVIPLFVDQVVNGRPMTITNPEMTRFLMSLDESVSLVNYAFDHAESGDLFVRKAPACTVEVLARAVAALFGDDDPEIKLIGSRHGEKLYESLLGREERARSVDTGDYFRVPLDARSLEYELFFDEGSAELAAADDYNSHNTEQLDIDQVKGLLSDLPEIRALIAARA
ncbi:polysaccharide biosynthesis protein [Aeromicrobium sp.]|uniref:polysaccharide biosynthesis protein n=1 Tax=Aeromicrobium sp. TaxID=1871063 RepID=UPI003D6A3FDA